MKRTILVLALLALSAPALACMGTLINQQFLGTGWICTYRLLNGDVIRVLQPNGCPLCP